MLGTDVTPLVLSDDNTSSILYLVNNFLKEMNMTQNKDFMAVWVLMSAVERIGTKIDGEYKLLQEYVGGHFRVLPATFWEEYFWRKMATAYRAKREKIEKTQGDSKDEEKEMNDWLISKIREFSDELFDWGCLGKQVKEFMKTMHGSNDLVDTVLFDLMKSVDLLAIKREKAEQEKRKADQRKKK